MHESAPEILTERLRLRAYNMGDFEFLVKMWSDPRTTEFIDATPRSREVCWAKFLRMIGHWKMLGYGYWLVEERTTRAPLGEAGLSQMMREIDPPLGDDFEVGYAFAPEACGQGYATEAVEAAVKWGQTTFPEKGFCCIISPENAPSLKVAEKCGFRRVAMTQYKSGPTILLRR